MAHVKKTVLVMHSAEQMYRLVDQVEDYPSFLPWCGQADLVFRDESKTCATLHIDYHGVKQKFTTENSKHFPSHMHLRLKDGPFKHLEGNWNFIALGENACKVEFDLEYDFTNAFLERLISPVFSYICNTFVDCFVNRADKISQNLKES